MSSHTVNVTRTTTTVTSSKISFNAGYFKTLPGLLKLLQTLLGIVCVSLMGYFMSENYFFFHHNLNFMLHVCTTFMIVTFTIFLSSLLSPSTATVLPKTLFELIYHLIGFILLFSASVTVLITINQYNYRNHNEKLLAVGIIGLINSVLYLISAVFAYRHYRGL